MSIDLREYFMKLAYQQALIAFEEDEVPIGAVIVSDNKVLAKAYNQTERLNDATAHAEMLAITAAANALGSKYLMDCTLYVTVEPCMMCATALFWSKIGGVYYGASDNAYGFTKFDALFTDKTELQSGIMENECSQLMRDFFKRRRELDQL